MYPARGNTGRELFSRDYNSNNSSERWCQQLDGSQEWSPQVYGSQDSQRLSALTYRPPPPMGSSSQGSNSGQGGGGGGQGGGRAPPAQPPDLRDITLARDIRFGLHTILCVMQKLPGEVKEACSEVSRASLQPEVTRGLIADTSDKLQQLVSDLQDKLTHLHATHNNHDGQHSLVLSEEEMGRLVSKVEAAVNHCRQQHLAAIKANFSSDLRGHLKEICDSLQELNRVEPAVKNLEEHFTQVAETITTSVEDLKTSVEDLKTSVVELKTCVVDLKTSVVDLKTGVVDLKTDVAKLKHMHQEHPNQLRMDNHLTHQPSFDKVEASIEELAGKLSTFSKEVTSHFFQAMREMGQVGGVAASSSTSTTRLVSPAHRVFSTHRPIFPLAESGHRCQVSPVAHVSPVPQVSPHVPMAPPASHPTPTHQPGPHTPHNPQPTRRVPPPLHPTPTPITRPGIPPSPNPSATLHYRPGIAQPSVLCATTQSTLDVAQPSDLRATPHCRPDVAVAARAVPQTRLSVTWPTAIPHSTAAPASNVALKEADQGRPSVNTHKDRKSTLHPKNNNAGAKIWPEVVWPEEDGDTGDDQSQSLGCLSSWPQHAGTQRFTPPKIYTLIQLTSDSDQETLVLDCDSSSNSDASPMVLSRVTAGLPAPPTNTAGLPAPPTNTAGLSAPPTNTAGLPAPPTNTAGLSALPTNTTGFPASPTNTDDWVEGAPGFTNSSKPNIKLEKRENHSSASGPIIRQIGVATVKKEIVTPNVRKTPTMVVGGPVRGSTVRSCDVVSGSKGGAAGTVWGSGPGDGASEIIQLENISTTPHLLTNGQGLYPHSFAAPLGPLSIKKRKLQASSPWECCNTGMHDGACGKKNKEVNGECAPQKTPGSRFIDEIRARRYLTPIKGRGIKLRFFKSKKNACRDT